MSGALVARARRSATASATGSSSPRAVGGGIARVDGRRRRAHTVRGVRGARARGGRPAAAARAARADPAAARGSRWACWSRSARRQAPGRDVLPVRGPRLHAPSEVDERIDNVVRGLIAIGVRQGEHVGVLMGTRPSALALAVAISTGSARSRCCCGPTATCEREVELGQVQRIIADPERAALAAGLRRRRTRSCSAAEAARASSTCRGRDRHGADRPRRGHAPALVPAESRAAPSTWRSSCSRARADGTRMSRITNRRWAMSAFGTASSAALTDADTVYSVTPAVSPVGADDERSAARSPAARASRWPGASTRTTFWDEVRRYGVTVASYTWTLLHDIVEAPPVPGRAPPPGAAVHRLGHAPRAVAPGGAAVRPRRVLEFYASTEAGAILVNLRDVKPGSMGRPLPGSADVRIAAYDLDVGGLELGPRRVRARMRGRRGRDAARARQPDRAAERHAAAGRVRARGRVAGHRRSVPPRRRRRLLAGRRRSTTSIRTARRPGVHRPIRDALYDIPAVDLAVAYGVLPAKGEAEIAVAAVTLRAGQRAERKGPVRERLSGLAVHARPAVVHVVDEIPVTTWYRPLTTPLRDAGVPQSSDAARRRGTSTRPVASYRPLTQTARRRLTKRAA